jgi:hypothetical protein
MGFSCLVAWGGIEPPTQGFSMEILVRKKTQKTRKTQTYQALTAQSTAINFCQKATFCTQLRTPLPEIVTEIWCFPIVSNTGHELVDSRPPSSGFRRAS